MTSLVSILYLLLLLIFILFGAIIVFHLLYYKINRHVSGMMSIIYVIGAVLLLISNFILFAQVEWPKLFSGFKL
ncbi:MAG: hypothetical protein PHF35_04975 [Candidatus Moranbacteria bacterium]|nr:hypothetical protein [Candidatus Moranbacteria bacterium]